jgi:hypothetical protein
MVRRAVVTFTLAAALALVVASCTVVAGCALPERRPEDVGPKRVQASDRGPVTSFGSQDGQEARGFRVELAGRALPDASARSELAAAAQRFAVTLAAWLYGSRSKMTVAPVAPALRRELAKAPPYVPRQQIGTRSGRSTHARVYLQTARSGVLVIVIRDSRTAYPIPARFERRAGRWTVVRLNTH